MNLDNSIQLLRCFLSPDNKLDQGNLFHLMQLQNKSIYLFKNLI